MATIFNPWQSDQDSNSTEIEPATPAEDTAEDATESETEDTPISEALKVITQQSQLITKLMAMLDPSSSAPDSSVESGAALED